MPAASGVVFALHGFLGRAADWSGLRRHLPAAVHFSAEDLFSPDSPPLGDFAGQTSVLAQKIESLVRPTSGPKIFLGYSLGGRLGLHLLQAQPRLFDQYIFLSVNPGLPEAASHARQQRREQDARWADKIRPGNWDQFIGEWNAQPVFAGSGAEPARLCGDYDLEKLRTSLTRWSLGLQPDFAELLREHRDHVTWVVGDRDKKYVALAEDLKVRGILAEYVAVEGGHRLWADSPAAIAALIASKSN